MALYPVLVADDDRLQRMTLRRILEKAQLVPVEEVENGEMALMRLRQPPLPCVMLLDLMMPMMDGMEVLQQLQQENIRVPVIMLTGIEDNEKAVQAMTLGAADFISKPADPRRVMVSVYNILRKQGIAIPDAKLQAEPDISLPRVASRRAE